MANQDSQSANLPRRKRITFARRHRGAAASARGGRWVDSPYVIAYRRLLDRHRRLVRRVGIGCGVLAAILLIGCFGLWWRLASGPIEVDAVTPWLASAIEENFGGNDRVEVGGTQIERTDSGATAVRIRDIVVRDADGTVVARAPKAEVQVSAMSLLSGHIRAESLNLVGAQLHVRIERDGEVTVFAGAEKHPIATASVPPVTPAATSRSNLLAAAGAAQVPAAEKPETVPASASAPSPRQTSDALAAMLSWIDGIGETGLDGHDLRELGLKEGTLTVDDARTGTDWSLTKIGLSLERPRGGGVVIKLRSDNSAHPWSLIASVRPIRNGFRRIELEAHHVLAEDLLRTFRFGDADLRTTVPVSASIRGVIGADGVPEALSGQVVVESGFVGDNDNADGRIPIDRAQFKFDWDSAQRMLSVPFQILSAGNRITLLAQVEAPQHRAGAWTFKIGGGTVVLATPESGSAPLILDRIAVSGSYDPVAQRLRVDSGDIGNANISVAMSGSATYTNGDVLLNAGLAGKRMSVVALKRLWPVFMAPKVRDWFDERLLDGTLDHITIAVNAPLNTLKASGPPIPENGLWIDAFATGCVVRPVDGLPALENADLTVHIVGRDAKITLGKATARLPSGRKLVLSSGVFEVPDTAPHEPPARVHFKLDGPVQAAAELLATDRLRDVSGAPFDPATSRGSVSAQITLALPLKPDLSAASTDYSITVDANDFSADHMIMGQRLEATVLHGSATPQGFQFNGNVKIAGAPAQLEYRKMRGDSEAEIQIKGMLDATARRNLGLDPANTIIGTIPIRVSGKVDAGSNRDGHFAVDADLTSAQITGFLPGWVKSAGKPEHLSLQLTVKPQSMRIDDLQIDGTGKPVRGTVEFNGSGDLQAADFPSYGFSDGDQASLKAERTSDGALRVVMRGEVYDGRAFIKALTGGTSGRPGTRGGKQHPLDIDLDLKFGAVLGFNGEALSDVTLKMSRRAGEIRSLGLSAKIGRDGTVTGELQGEPDGRQVVYLRTNDAGALFRATDVYSRMIGGRMAMVMDAPSPTNTMQQGAMDVRDFKVRNESELERAAAGSQTGAVASRGDLEFSSMRVNFTRAPGRIALRNGVVRGPLIGGTIDGLIDYQRDTVDLRGTLVPLYAPNNLFGWIPLVGPILGGEKEGLFGYTYQVVGRPGKPVLNVNLISGLAPGILRKIFEYPATTDKLIDSAR